MNDPLKGIRVLDLSQVWAGPMGGMLLADFGAEVIKVEPPGTGDHSRAWSPPGCRGESPHILSANRNKKSITLNLKAQAGREIFLRLVRETDVLLENFRPGVMEKFGLHYPAVQPVNPRLIYCSISGFGQTGPARDDAAYDLIIQGMGGAMSVTGEEGGYPQKPGLAQADIMGALTGTIGILTALIGRGATGEGCHLDVSLLDIQVLAMGHQIVTYFLSGEVAGPLGTAHPILTPYQSFPTKSYAINIAALTPAHWADLCRLLEVPSLIHDRLFGNIEARKENRKRLIPLLEEAFRKRTAEEWLPLLKGKGIPCGPINNVSMLVEDPQVLHRNMIVEIDNPVCGKVKIPGLPIKMSGMRTPDPVPPPRLGEHNEEIYRERLAFTPEEMAKMQSKGII